MPEPAVATAYRSAHVGGVLSSDARVQKEDPLCAVHRGCDGS